MRRGGRWRAFPLSSKNQVVWRITVDDLSLRERRSGYARVGGWFSGLWSEQVDVKWSFTADELGDGRRAGSG